MRCFHTTLCTILPHYSVSTPACNSLTLVTPTIPITYPLYIPLYIRCFLNWLPWCSYREKVAQSRLAFKQLAIDGNERREGKMVVFSFDHKTKEMSAAVADGALVATRFNLSQFKQDLLTKPWENNIPALNTMEPELIEANAKFIQAKLELDERREMMARRRQEMLVEEAARKRLGELERAKENAVKLALINEHGLMVAELLQEISGTAPKKPKRPFPVRLPRSGYVVPGGAAEGWCRGR